MSERAIKHLRELAAGRYAHFSGLPRGLTRPQVVEALGPAFAGPQSDKPAADDARTAWYGEAEGAPIGLTVTFYDDLAVRVEIVTPRAAKPIEEQLGPPESVAESLLGTTRDQWIWAERGLTAHVNRISGDVDYLYAYRSMSLDEYLDSSLASVSSTRIPRPDPED